MTFLRWDRLSCAAAPPLIARYLFRIRAHAFERLRTGRFRHIWQRSDPTRPCAVASCLEGKQLFGRTAGRAISAASVEAQQNQPPAPRPTAVLLSCPPIIAHFQMPTDASSDLQKIIRPAAPHQQPGGPKAMRSFAMKQQAHCIECVECLQPGRAGGTAWPMKDDPRERVLSVVERMPEWLRHDLAMRDEATRKRAEETLAGMIASALTEHAEN